MERVGHEVDIKYRRKYDGCFMILNRWVDSSIFDSKQISNMPIDKTQKRTSQ